MQVSEADLNFFFENCKAKQRVKHIESYLSLFKRIKPFDARFIVKEVKRLKTAINAAKKGQKRRMQVVCVDNEEVLAPTDPNTPTPILEIDETELGIYQLINEQINANNKRSNALANVDANYDTRKNLLTLLKIGWQDVNDLKNQLFFYKKNGRLPCRAKILKKTVKIKDIATIEGLKKLRNNLYQKRNTRLKRLQSPKAIIRRAAKAELQEITLKLDEINRTIKMKKADELNNK